MKLINDWKYLFNEHAIGGRFANFTFIHISWFNVGLEEVDGLSFILLGLGIRIGGQNETKDDS